MTTTTALDIRPQAGYIGAEIHGVDLTRPLDAEVVAEIRTTLLQWKVVFFRDQDLTPDAQTTFASRFGTVTEAHPVLPSTTGHPSVLAIDGAVDRASWWHTDVTFLDTPPLGSIPPNRQRPSS